MAGRLAEEVVILTHGNEDRKEELERLIAASVLEKTTVNTRKIKKAENLDGKDGNRIRVWFEDGAKKELGFLAYLSKSRLTLLCLAWNICEAPVVTSNIQFDDEFDDEGHQY